MSEQISLSGSRQWQAGQWLGFGAMDSVSEINAQCLDLLCSTAADSPHPLPGLLASHQARWCGLSPIARAQLASSAPPPTPRRLQSESRSIRLNPGGCVGQVQQK